MKYRLDGRAEGPRRRHLFTYKRDMGRGGGREGINTVVRRCIPHWPQHENCSVPISLLPFRLPWPDRLRGLVMLGVG